MSLLKEAKAEIKALEFLKGSKLLTNAAFSSVLNTANKILGFNGKPALLDFSSYFPSSKEELEAIKINYSFLEKYQNIAIFGEFSKYGNSSLGEPDLDICLMTLEGLLAKRIAFDRNVDLHYFDSIEDKRPKTKEEYDELIKKGDICINIHENMKKFGIS